MQDVNPPAFPPQWQPLVDRAANGLRQLALNEEAKARFCNDALLRPFMHRIARRYVAGQSIGDVLERVREINRRGHAASADYMGESCPQPAVGARAPDLLGSALNDRGDSHSARSARGNQPTLRIGVIRQDLG
jgi:hypothetical protein